MGRGSGSAACHCDPNCALPVALCCQGHGLPACLPALSRVRSGSQVVFLVGFLVGLVAVGCDLAVTVL